MTRTNRLLSLDILRLVAILMVFVCHLNMEANPPQWLQHYLWFGGMGVDLFFVLSGFLVGGLLFDEFKNHGTLSIKRFYVRRAWKIYPAFYLLIGISYLFTRFVLGSKIHDRNIFAEIFFFQNYAPGYWNHTWSLAVEEHFYIVLPLLLWFLARRTTKPFAAVPWLVGGISVALLAARAVTLHVVPVYNMYTHHLPTHLRVDALFFGVGIAYFYHFRDFSKLHRWRHALTIAGILGLVTVPMIAWYYGQYYLTAGLTWEYLSCGCFLVGLLLCDIPRNKFTLALATVGSYSYSIYLWHMVPTKWITPHMAGTPWLLRAIVVVAFALVGGMLMSKICEVPVLRLRDRLFPSTMKPPAPKHAQAETLSMAA